MIHLPDLQPYEKPLNTPQQNPVPTVDVVIRIKEGIVLIRRKNPPFGWALPGGFMDVGETCEQAAVREAKEETDLDVELEHLLGVYSDPRRDPRKHTLTVVYIATGQGTPIGLDDAAEARIFRIDDLPSPIVFDHEQIIHDYRHFVTTGQLQSPKNSEG